MRTGRQWNRATESPHICPTWGQFSGVGTCFWLLPASSTGQRCRCWCLDVFAVSGHRTPPPGTPDTAHSHLSGLRHTSPFPKGSNLELKAPKSVNSRAQSTRETEQGLRAGSGCGHPSPGPGCGQRPSPLGTWRSVPSQMPTQCRWQPWLDLCSRWSVSPWCRCGQTQVCDFRR